MKSDLEINKALALAIGWPQALLSSRGVVVQTYNPLDRVKSGGRWLIGWRIFDHTDWNVASPIAERYGLTVDFRSKTVWTGDYNSPGRTGTTTQEAIALKVIEGAKK